MRVLLLALDGEETRARAVLEQLYPNASIESVARSQIENSSFLISIKALRSRRPEVFAISVENLEWQRGQNLLSLFAALTGANEIIALDANGSLRKLSGTKTLILSPPRLLSESWSSMRAIVKSRSELSNLESAIEKDAQKISGPKPENADSLKIAYLRATPGAGTHAGGASSHINGFINAASAAGARIRVISNDYISGLDVERFPLKLVPMEPVGVTQSAFDLRNNLVFTQGALKEMVADNVDLIYQRYSRFTWAGVTASLVTGKPLFLEYNGSEVWVGKHWDDSGMFSLLERIEKLNLKAAARVFVVSEVERRNLLRAGVADKKIIVNPNGVDVEKFRPNIGGSHVRKELGLEDDEVLAGFVGSFGPWHGVIEMAKAIALIPGDVRLRFLLVGHGKLREQVESIIKECGATQRVIFTGTVTHDRVPVLLDACDILVSPHIPLEDGSEFFGSPTKLFEYMAMAKGIVASRLGQIAEVLTHEKSALLVEPGDVEDLARQIVRLVESAELRTCLGRKAREIVEEHYTWNHNAKRVLDAYDSWFVSSDNDIANS